MSDIYATPKGTAQKAEKHPTLHYQPLGLTDFNISEVGFGTYRVSKDSDTHSLVLQDALKEGINLIDTSSNYGDGDAELLIGSVLNDLISAKEINRNEIVIVSKGGYIQGQNYIDSQELKSKNKPLPDLVEYSKGLEHCIHPEFLADQITKSLNRLDLNCIDIYLLHNPEYFLMTEKLKGTPIKSAQETFYHRIKMAFQHLESEVKFGRIQYYGISSNTFPADKNEYDFIDINILYEIAESINPNHHFKVVQFPLNLIESNHSILSTTEKYQLGVLINRPFNAFLNGQLIRLVDFLIEDDVSSLEIEDLVQELSQFESTSQELNLSELGFPEEHIKLVETTLSFGNQLSQYWQTFHGYEDWKTTLSSYFLPQIESMITTLTSIEALGPKREEWIHIYLSIFNQAIHAVSLHYKAVSSYRSNQIKHILNQIIPEWQRIITLSQKAIHGLRELNGIHCILTGIRSEDYLRDILIELKQPLLNKTDKHWKRLSLVTNEISKL